MGAPSREDPSRFPWRTSPEIAKGTVRERSRAARELFPGMEIIAAPFDRAMMTMPWEDFVVMLAETYSREDPSRFPWRTSPEIAKGRPRNRAASSAS